MSRKNTRMAKEAILIFFITATMTTCISDRPEDENSSPQIAVDKEGNSYLTWIGHRISCDRTQDIFWTKINSEGVRGPILKVSTHPDSTTSREWNPQIALDEQKNSYIVWQGPDGEDSEIYWVKVDAEGVPGEAMKISTHPDNAHNDEYNARIAVDGLGTSYVVWEGFDRYNDSDTFEKDIYWVKVDAEGVPGEVMKISTHPDNINYSDHSPEIVIDAEGNSTVVWYGCDGEDCNYQLGDYEIYLVRINAEGIPGEVQKISALLDKTRNYHSFPQIAVDRNGNFYVAWFGGDEDNCGIYWVKIDTEGVPGEIQKISAHPDDVDSIGSNLRIAIDAEGNSYLTWQRCAGKYCAYGVGDYEIRWVKTDTRGIPSAVLTISVHPENLEERVENPGIAVDAQGNSGLVWSGHRGHDIEVYWAKIDAEGVPGKVLRLSTYPGSNKFDDEYPQITVDAEGNFYVTWNTVKWYVDEGIPQDMYWVRIDAEGTPGKLQKISVDDLDCESPREDYTYKMHSFTAVFQMYYFDSVGIALLLIFKCVVFIIQ